MSKSKAAKPAPATEEAIPTLNDENVWNALLARDDEYPEKFKSATADVEFFDLLQELPESVWENRFLIYLYRLDPVIRNKSGEKSYLCKVAYPIDEEWIRKNYGGGKYHLYLKDARDTLKETKPRFEGVPKFEEGQTVGNSGTPAVAAAPAAEPHQSDVAQILDATQRAAGAQAEMMQAGMERALDLQNKVVEKSLGLNQPAAANPLTTITELIGAIKAMQPAQDPLVTQLVKAAIENMTNKAPAHEPEAPEPLGKQMETIRALTGADSLPELFRKMNPSRAADDTPAWIPVALNVVSSLLDKLPDILLRNNEAKAMDLQRAMLMQQGKLPGATNLQPITIAPPTPRAAPQPIAPTTINAAPVVTQDSIAQAIPAIVNIIASAFDRNFEGAFAAESIDFQFPGILEAVRPLMGNAEKLSQFVAGVPALAQRSTALEWPDFQADFLAYINVDDDHQADQSAPPTTQDGPKAVTATGAA